MLQYRQLTFERFFSFTSMMSFGLMIDTAKNLQKGTCVAIGVCVHEAPVGLAVATYTDSRRLEAKITFLYILPEFRNQGFGTGLLKKLIKEMGASGVQQLSFTYGQHHPWSEAIHHITAKIPMETAREYHFITLYKDKQPLRSLWQSYLRRIGSLKKTYRIVRFQDVPSWLGQALDKEWREKYQDYLSPVQYGQDIGEWSRFLVKDEEILGWILICPVSTHVVDVPALFIRPEYRQTGLFLFLMDAGLGPLDEEHRINRVLLSVDVNNHGFLSVVTKGIERSSYPYTKSLLIKKCWQGGGM